MLEGFSGELSYLIPESLHIEVGFKVIVPLGERLSQGLVTSIDDNPPTDFQLKEIVSISSSFPLFDEQVLETSLLADLESFNQTGYHLSNYLYQPPSPKIHKLVKLTGIDSNLTPKEQEIIDAIKSNDSNIKLTSLNIRLGKKRISYSLRKLLTLGVIQIEQVLETPKFSFETVWKFDGEPKDETEEKIKEIIHLATNKSEIHILSGASTYKINKLIKEGKIISATKKPTPAKKGLEKFGFSVNYISQASPSKRTEEYIRISNQLVAENRSIVIICSNIHACRKLFEDLKGKVSNLHLAIGGLGIREATKLSESVRAKEQMVIIGMQTALLLPVPNLSQIIVDEPLSPYMDITQPHTLHLGNLAKIRAKISECPLSFYSSPVMLESNIEGSQELDDLDVELVNMVYEPTAFEQPLLSGASASAVKKELEGDGQIIVYLNRKGFSSFVFCSECNEVLRCPKCKIPLTYSKNNYEVRCRYCGFQSKAPDLCPSCGGVSIRYKAGGIEKLQIELSNHFKNMKVLRADGDTKESAKNISDFNNGDCRILIGTSMILDRVDFEKAGLVLVASLDGLLSMPIYSASHKAYSTLATIREKTAGRVMFQTYLPLHPLIKAIATKKLGEFLENEKQEREDALYPPFSQLLFFHVISKKETTAKKDAEMVTSKLLEILDEESVSSPNKGYFHRLKGEYRWDIMVKTSELNKYLASLRKLFFELKESGVRVEITNPNL